MMLPPPTTVDPSLTPQAIQNFQIASWIVVGVFVLIFRRLIWRLLFGGRRRRRFRLSSMVAPLRMAPSYDDNIHSAHWKATCDEYWATRGRWCHWPGCRVRVGLQLHHLTYRHEGRERQGELIGVCRFHHTELHRLFDVRGDPAAFAGQIRFLSTRQRRSA